MNALPQFLTRLPFLFLFFTVISCSKQEQELIDREAFNDDWKFDQKDTLDCFLSEFDDSSWRNLNLPHDWSIEGTYSEMHLSGNLGGYLPTGIGWYRKTFQWDTAWKNKQVFIRFDGVYMNSEVWINGQYLGKRPNGYVTFEYDLTPHLTKGNNVIAVKVDNSEQPNSRWYTGSGIYRNVWLLVHDRLAFNTDETFITTTDISEEQAKVNVSYGISNSYNQMKNAELLSYLIDQQGKKGLVNKTLFSVPATDSVQFSANFMVDHPKLWSPENPNLYKLESRLVLDGDTLSRQTETFGIRSIRFDSETGFWLNENNIKVRGVNNHHDAGPVGAAVPKDVLLRRLLIMKDMGANALRTSHNPFAPEFYDLCDSLGFLVMDEIFDEWIASWPWEKEKTDEGKVPYGYHKYYKEWHEKDLRDVIRRDRNHPSVFIWSVGNEIPDQCYASGPERLKQLMEIVKEEDSTRPVTAGCCFIHLANETGFASLLDVTGYNGGGGSVFYERDKAIYPDRKFIATEIPHTFQTRGVYKTKSYMRAPHQGIPVPDLTEEEVFPETSPYYSSSYDNSSVRLSARDSWRRTDGLAYVSGEFRWTGFDYLGESNMGWPARFFNFGILDLCGFPKDTYYFYKSQWTEELMVHVLPHWTWSGKEGISIPVWVYSNADSVELLLNDSSLGTKTMTGKMNLEWVVPYQAGKLEARAYKNGEVVSHTHHTAEASAKIELTSDKTALAANGNSVAHITVRVLDENGYFVPHADNLINFEVDGPAKIIGVENGDPLDHDPHKVNYRKAFNGMCLLMVQSTEDSGSITITASAEGLETTTLTIESK
ncbi:MAG: glycoside hydrolase family 2 TIM barrel-domain containing protein [Bacteroidota bacterium]